jgi:hypothetical protein
MQGPAQGRHLREILDAGQSSFSELKNLVVWNKDNGVIRAIDQHWIQKAEAPDAVGNLSDLPARMGAGIALVGNQIVDRYLDDRGMAEFCVCVQDKRPFLGFQLGTRGYADADSMLLGRPRLILGASAKNFDTPSAVWAKSRTNARRKT